MLIINSVFASANCHDYTFKSRLVPGGLVSAAPTEVGFNAAKLSLVDAQINSDVKHGFPGAALLIIKDGKVVKQTVYGYKLKYDLNTSKPLAKPELVTCDTLFDLASNTKMYAVNFALMHLVYLGKLDINKPINYYIPEYKGCDKNGQCRQERTVRDLLTHSAGYMPDPQFFNPRMAKLDGENLYSQNRELTESIILSRMPFMTKRGGKPNYSDLDYMLLGILVERISGMRLDEYVKNNIFKPLGLHNTVYNPLQNGIAQDRCAATEIMGNTRSRSINFPQVRTKPIQCQVHDENAYYSLGGVSGHAGLFSDLADMAVLVDVLLNKGSYALVRLWNTQVQQEFLTPVAANDTFGLGWRLAGSRQRYKLFGYYASNQAFGHTGWTGTITLVDPKYNLAIVLLTNKKHSIYQNGKFAGDIFATGQYYPIINLIYNALPSTQK